MSNPMEDRAFAHAARGGHVCGDEAALRVCASGILRAADPDVTDVYVFPDETLCETGDKMIRYRNSPEMIAALDRYLLTGELPEVGAGFHASQAVTRFVTPCVP